MDILITCEESQEICMAFRQKGHNAYSNDIQECSGGYPEWHILGDCMDAVISKKWDIIIMHPPCTYTCLSGNRWYHNSELRLHGAEFTKKLWSLANLYCDNTCLEQPKTIMQKYIGKKSQSIQPWQFGHGEVKETWLWIRGLPLLVPTNIVSGRDDRIFKMKPSPNRGKERSKTYSGIAKAMSDQWG